jgi:Tat protein secretion system quality control protein TatD with DNase activity
MWRRAQGAGVSDVLLAGVDAQDWQAQERLAHLPRVYFSAGLHPQCVAGMTPDAMERELGLLRAWWQSRSAPHSRWRALGEIGLDGVAAHAH